MNAKAAPPRRRSSASDNPAFAIAWAQPVNGALVLRRARHRRSLS
ncbi:MAG: hypothetical protein ACLTMP_08335 [Eggerthella lenta]